MRQGIPTSCGWDCLQYAAAQYRSAGADIPAYRPYAIETTAKRRNPSALFEGESFGYLAPLSGSSEQRVSQIIHHRQKWNSQVEGWKSLLFDLFRCLMNSEPQQPDATNNPSIIRDYYPDAALCPDLPSN